MKLLQISARTPRTFQGKTYPAPSPLICVLGATSIVGSHLARYHSQRILPLATPYNRSPLAASWQRVKVEVPGSLKAVLKQRPPASLLYCHAVCDVAKCESHPDWARRLNVQGLEEVLDSLAPETRLLYLSSDHVFGEHGSYTEDCLPAPISAYGRTRAEAEQRVLARANSLVVRAGLPIGRSIDGRSGYWDWLRYRQSRGLPVTIIRDEYRSAVWAVQLARRLLELMDSSLVGLRHIPAVRIVSRPELARHLLQAQPLPANFRLQSRHEQPVPHLGRVEVRSKYGDRYARPLPSAADLGIDALSCGFPDGP